MTIPDEELARRAARGDGEAFALLFRTHYRRVYAFCQHRLSHSHDAEDCAQEAFSQAWSSLQRGSHPEAFRPWLFTIAARACHRRYAERAGLTLGEDIDRPSPSFEDGVIDRMDARVASALSTLEPTDRSIFELADRRGQSIGAVARRLGLPPRHVEGSLFRTRRALRAELEPSSSPARTRLLRC